MAVVERPFTARDVIRHTLVTWAAAMCVIVVNLLTTNLPDVGSFIFMIGAIVFGLTWLGAPLAWALGRAMKSVRSVTLHLLAFGALGYLAATLLAIAPAVVSGSNVVVVGAPHIVALGLGCAVCVIVGRSVAFLLRRRDDRRAARVRPSLLAETSFRDTTDTAADSPRGETI